MGKNRKPRNVVDQMQTQNPFCIETENLNQEVPEDYLTSDNFSIVQKKKGLKKLLDGEDCISQPQLNSNRVFVKDEGNHLNFWTSKSNVTVNEGLISSQPNDSMSKSKEIFEDVLSCSVFQSNESNNDDIELNAGILVEEVNVENVIHSDISGKDSNNIFVQGMKSEPLNSVREKHLDSILSHVELPMTENVSYTKKRNKKNMRKYSSEHEVERLLKELEINKKPPVLPQSINTVIYTSNNLVEDLEHLKKDNTPNNMSDLIGISSNEEVNLELQNDNLNTILKNVCDTSNDLNNIFTHNSHKNKLEESVSCTSKSNVVSTQKKKQKKLKAKQKKVENNSLVCAQDCKKHLESALVQSEENVACKKEEKLTKSKSISEADKRKKPSRKQLEKIHEALRKAKEDEERLQKEEEAKQKLAEEAERIRLEKLRLEQEKKEKRKLKEKQRREKMKAEGRLLSKSQKQSRARMEATLAALRQQGIDVPQICDKKSASTHGPRLGNCKNFHRKRFDSCQSTQSIDSAIVILERQKSESFSSMESSGKESLSDLPSSFDSIDDLAPESDKGQFSYSEESDALDDNLNCCKTVKNIVTEGKMQIEKISAKSMSLSHAKALESNNKLNIVKYRSPVVCVLGHVDTGKTKILDYIRKTHIQDSEAGGITQQIGATMIPRDALKDKCKMVKDFLSFEMKIPGLLVIDTPGHESFSNLRSRGSSVCDIAVLVVDIMHGLEPQTVESINLLKKGKIPFVVALNKVDRIYGWKSCKDDDIKTTIQNQSAITQMEFRKRCQEIILQFANLCLNAALFFENKDPRSFVSMVPTSAITGDGMGNILALLSELTQSLMQKRLIYSEELEATVLEVKAIPGLGTTVDVILVNGCLQEGDTIVLAGQEGPIVTQIRSLLMPQPLKELRVKNPYIEYKAIEGAQGVKVAGKDLDKSIAGLPLLIAHNQSAIESLKNEINCLFHDTVNSIRTSERGVYVQASTLGSLEALLQYLSSSGIPYFSVKIGPVVKKDVMKASIMLEHDILFAAILAFDVKIERDAQELADSLGVHIFQADIIYHLFDMYMKYKDDLLLKRQDEAKRLAIFPCKLKVLPDFVFSVKDPIVLGIHVETGTLREGTPLCVPSRNILEIGTVSAIELNKSKVDCAKKGDDICITINPKAGELPKTYGKHFSHEDLLVSRISRQSIDACKEHYRNELLSSDWHLMVELKKMLHIV